MKKATRDQLMKILSKQFPKMWMKDSEEFDGQKNAIWTGEGSYASDGTPLFDHYAEDPNETLYVMGVYKPLHNLLEEYGYYAEFYDAGTVFIQE